MIRRQFYLFEVLSGPAQSPDLNQLESVYVTQQRIFSTNEENS